MKTVLVLAANPIESVRFQFHRELSEIQKSLERGRERDTFKVEFEPAADWDRWRQRLLDCKPEIVHFVGHGNGLAGLVLEGSGAQDVVQGKRFAQLLMEFSMVRCVLLNACHSKVQAAEIFGQVQQVRYVMGMKQTIAQESSRQFAIAFYDGVFAGRDYESAFRLGKTGIKSSFDDYKPHLFSRNEVQEPIELEQPGSRMSVESKFYVMRSPAETDAVREVVKPGALIRIKAPHEFGKSSLMGRVVAQAEACGAKTVSINFREVDREAFESLKSFLHYFCLTITRKLRFDDKISDYWEYQGPKADCAEYFEDYLLPQIGNALVLELDEVDLLFDESLMRSQDMIDFFGMLRAWHDSKKEHPQWRKLKLVLVHCQDVPHEKFPKSQSPFNVGTEVDLVAFSLSQVQDLAVRHGLDPSIASGVMALVGGHPQLVRLGLYAVARGESLETLGATEAGLYGNHLRRVRSKLEGNPELKMAFQRVLAGGSIDQASSAALRSLGVGKFQENRLQVTCELYCEYFRSVWS